MVVKISMITIPAGTTQMRDDRKKEVASVDLKPFKLATFPVTELEYLGTNAKYPNRPITNISWFEAIKFCNELSKKEGLAECYEMSDLADDGISIHCDFSREGYRLPTEAEWQHACHAGNSQYQYGELKNIAWFNENSEGSARDVGLKAPNSWGLFDMLGNVWEWCWDIYDLEVYRSYRVFRGGSWAEDARGCGATCRRRSHPTFFD